jgi:hypothetical protein
MPRISFLSLDARRQTQLLFWPEWLALGAIAVLDLALARHIGFHVIWRWRDILPGFALIGASLAARRLAYPRTGLILEYAALNGIFITVMFVLTYLSLAMSGPLMDTQFLAIDRAMGFDWLKGYRFFTAHPHAAMLLQLLYRSPGIQALYFSVLFALLNDRARLRQVFWLFLLALLLTCAGAWLFPAYGPFKTFGLESHGAFLPDMEHLRSDHNLVFAMGHMTGVICFPSFHTVLALGYIYAFRRTGLIGALIAAANIVMLAAIPFVGGHYLIDMIAGAGVAFFCMAGVEWGPMLWKEIGAVRLGKAVMAMTLPAAKN